MSMIPSLQEKDLKKLGRMIETVSVGDSDRMDANLECGARCSVYVVGKVVRTDLFLRN